MDKSLAVITDTEYATLERVAAMLHQSLATPVEEKEGEQAS